MPPVPIRIDARPIGHSIEVNGQDVTGMVAAAELHLADNQPSVLTLHLIADGTIEGDAIVRTVEQVPTDDGQAIAGFLDQIDPDELEHIALQTADASCSSTKVMLQVLACWAKGEKWPDPT